MRLRAARTASARHAAPARAAGARGLGGDLQPLDHGVEIAPAVGEAAGDLLAAQVRRLAQARSSVRSGRRARCGRYRAARRSAGCGSGWPAGRRAAPRRSPRPAGAGEPARAVAPALVSRGAAGHRPSRAPPAPGGSTTAGQPAARPRAAGDRELADRVAQLADVARPGRGGQPGDPRPPAARGPSGASGASRCGGAEAGSSSWRRKWRNRRPKSSRRSRSGGRRIS